MAISDKFVEETVTNKQDILGISLPVTRIPEKLSQSGRKSHLENLLASNDFELLSLQYVPYSFDRKGLPFWLLRFFENSIRPYQFHINFHELWIGFGTKSPLKHKLIGLLQQQILKILVARLKPQCITTSNVLYQHLLQQKNIQSELLNLFSNIPYLDANHSSWGKYQKKYTFLNLGSYDFILGIFGHIHPEADLKKTIEQFLQNSETNYKRVLVVSFGKMGPQGLEYWESLRSELQYDGRINLECLGLLEPLEVSYILQQLDAGISCTPAAFIGKSGVYAAFRSHDLRVIMANTAHIPGLEAASIANLETAESLPAEAYSVTHITAKFLNLITKTSTHD